MLLDQPPAGVPEGRRRRAVQVQQADVGHGGEQLPGQLARGDVRRGPDQALLAPGGERIGMIRLPETCANVCFGGQRRNRLFMAASQSLYAVYVGTQGAAPG